MLLFPPLSQDCTICMEPLAGPSGYKGPGVGPVSRAESVGRLTQCGHQYHFQCLVAMYNNGNKDGRYDGERGVYKKKNKKKTVKQTFNRFAPKMIKQM